MKRFLKGMLMLGIGVVCLWACNHQDTVEPENNLQANSKSRPTTGFTNMVVPASSASPAGYQGELDAFYVDVQYIKMGLLGMVACI